MAKIRIVHREQSRIKIVEKYKSIRKKFMEYKKRMREIQKLLRESTKMRSNEICFISGRSRGTFFRFGISRHFIREISYNGYIPGIKKSSW